MAITREKLRLIFEKCDGHCFYCGWPHSGLPGIEIKASTFGENWQAEHMTPRSQGGGDEIENLVLACFKCNRAKGNRTVDEYREALCMAVLQHIANAVGPLQRIYSNGVDDDVAKILDTLADAANLTWKLKPIFAGEVSQSGEDRNPGFWSAGFRKSEIEGVAILRTDASEDCPVCLGSGLTGAEPRGSICDCTDLKNPPLQM